MTGERSSKPRDLFIRVDAEVFERPDAFDITRDPNVHLAFGWGPHFCLGANLARAEIRCIFHELLTRLPDIDLNGPVRRLRSSTVNSIKSMPVRFTPTEPVGASA